METKHTPGIWLHSVVNKEIAINVQGQTIPIFVDAKCYRSFNENIANAKLIAAAPDLLSAVERFIKFANSQNLDYESAMVREAKAAFKKATE